MVGVKGRSKACRTCLRRKKGCGQQRPACEQCIKARIPCGGYAMGLIIIEHDPHSWSPEALTHTSSPTPGQASLVANSSSDTHHTHRISTRKSKKCCGSSSPRDVIVSSYTQKSLSRAAEEAKICGQFWNMFLPNRRALPLDMVRDMMGGWINAVQDLHPTDPVLRKTMLALSLTTLGKANKDEAMMSEGTIFYGKALGELSAALRFARPVGVDAILSAIRLFGVYEVLHGMHNADLSPEHRRASWLAHSVGEFSLISAQKPAMFAANRHHQLFIDGRLFLAALALRARVRTFLNTESWMTEPWSVHKKTPRDLIIDILLLLPGLFQDLDASSRYPPDTQDRIRAHLVHGCLDVQNRLLAWHSLYSAIPPLATCEEEIPGTIKAHDLAVAHLMSIYWATALMCTTLLETLLASLTGSPLLHTRISAERRKAFNPEALCRNIVNVLPVCLHPDAGMYSANLIAMQVSTATLHFSIIPANQMVKERLWLDQNLEKPQCVSIADFVWSLRCHGSELYSPIERGPDGGAIPNELLDKSHVAYEKTASLILP